MTWIVCSNCNETVRSSNHKTTCKYCGHPVEAEKPKTEPDAPAALSSFGILLAIGLAVLICWLAYENTQRKEQERIHAEILTEETAKQREEDAKRYEQERVEKELVLKQLWAMDENDLSKLLSDCKHAIGRKANESNNGPFGVSVIDQYSSDVYIVAAEMKKPHSTESIEKRVNDYKAVSEPSWVINSTFPVHVTYDTFSGPKKDIDFYTCDYSDGPSIKVIHKIL